MVKCIYYAKGFEYPSSGLRVCYALITEVVKNWVCNIVNYTRNNM